MTGNHGMLVYNEEDCKSPTKREQLVYAHDVKVGMKFRHYHRANDSEDSIELVEVVAIDEDKSNEVYNVVGYHFNIIANNMVVSSHGEDTKNVPELVFSLGKFIHNWVGVKASRKYYRAFD